MRLQWRIVLFVPAVVAMASPTLLAQHRPFTLDQVQGMVRDGLGDDSGAKLIEQRGIDFAPQEDFIRSLQAAGASEAFLAALRNAHSPQSPDAAREKPLTQIQVFALLTGGVPSQRVAMLVKERGIDFAPTHDYLEQVRLAGGTDVLTGALRIARVVKAATVDSVQQARQAEIQKHVARGAQLFSSHEYAQAEQEYRAALLLDVHNSDIYDALGSALISEKKYDDAQAALREAIRLNPGNELAHYNLGIALGSKGDYDGEIAEEQAALRLNPHDERAHVGIGTALGSKGDWDGAIPEYREAVRLNPEYEDARYNLGAALANKSDWNGAIAEDREAVRLNPKDAAAHSSLGYALVNSGDQAGALVEFRKACELEPGNADFKHNYDLLSRRMNP